MTLACAGCGQREFVESATPFFCENCRDTATPLRYCNRCGNESPEEELAASGGRCSWCRTADDIPWEEPLE